MPSKTIDFDVVREIALALPGVEENTLHGRRSLKVSGRLLTCPALHKSAEPNSLAVRIGFPERQALLDAQPDVYYVTDHYINYPAVLVRLSRIRQDSLRDLLGMAWRFVSSKRNRAAKRPKRPCTRTPPERPAWLPDGIRNMTAEKFRCLALSIPGSSESAHMGHPDFRLGGRIFATLGYPDEKCGMVKLAPAQQKKFLAEAPGVFSPCAGVWGRRGATAVHLALARVGLVRAALEEAGKNAVRK